MLFQGPSPRLRKQRTTCILTSLLMYAGLLGCSSQPVVEAPIAAPAPPLKPVITKVADKPFDTETLYALLVAEFAGDRQRFDVMLNNYVQQAKATQDPEVTARASRLARYLNAHDDSLAMALQWANLEPNNLEAHYNATIELTTANQLMPALEHAKTLVNEGQHASGLDAIAARALQINDEGLVTSLAHELQQLSNNHPDHIPALIGLSLLRQHLGQLEEALQLAMAAQAADPGSFQASAQETRVLQQMGRTDEALAKLGHMVEQHPNNDRLRLQYARSLIKVDIEAAEAQFLTLLNNSPEDPDINLTVALIQYELKKYAQAKSHFLLLTENSKRKATAHGYLGRIALIESNEVTAIRHFKQVTPSSDYLASMAKLSEIYLTKDEAGTALQYLAQESKKYSNLSIEHTEGLALLRSQVLSKTGNNRAAIDLLREAIGDKKQSVKLLYARAMLLTQENEITLAEQDLKALLKIEPNNAAALNALGYTLADKTPRLEEAYNYISQAYQLTPNDPAVIDSLGWVEYLRGNYERALKKLKKAMQTMPDHEIAAHLGEVLWVTGQQQEAQEVWQKGLSLKPDSEIINNTIKRLNAGLTHQPTPEQANSLP